MKKSTISLTLSGGENNGGILPNVTQIKNADDCATDDDDAVMEDVLKHMPVKHRRNAQHILDTVAKSKNSVSWTGQGELVVDGEILRGSHIFDLVKSITLPQGVPDDKRPLGWDKFLHVMAALNVPLSSVPNTQVRRLITRIKTGASQTPSKMSFSE